MNEADQEKTWKLIAPQKDLTQLPCRRLYCKEGKKLDLALYFLNDKFYAIDATCPHMGGPLDVIVDLEQLLDTDEPRALCPWHLYAYSLKTGEGLPGLKVQTYETKVENGNFFVLYQHDLSLHKYETSS